MSFPQRGQGAATDSRRAWRVVVGLWAASRALVVLVLWVSPRLPANLGETPTGVRQALVRWDAGWLLRIAAEGYREPHQAAFFPAFPSLVGVAQGLGLDPALAAAALNSLLALAAALLVFRLADRAHSSEVAILAAAVLLFHPLSFYLLVPYSEALFLALTAATFLALRSDRYLPAAACAGLAALTRNTGVLLALPIALHAFRSNGAGRRHRGLGVLAALAPLLALAGYSAFTFARFGDPFLPLRAQTFWQDHIAPGVPFAALLRDLGRWRGWVDHHLPLTLLGLYLAWRLVRARRWDYAAFVVPSLLLSLSLSKLAITPRLHLVLFPLWIEAALVLERLPRQYRWALAALSATAGLWLTFEFSRGLWVD